MAGGSIPVPSPSFSNTKSWKSRFLEASEKHDFHPSLETHPDYLSDIYEILHNKMVSNYLSIQPFPIILAFSIAEL